MEGKENFHLIIASALFSVSILQLKDGHMDVDKNVQWCMKFCTSDKIENLMKNNIKTHEIDKIMLREMLQCMFGGFDIGNQYLDSLNT